MEENIAILIADLSGYTALTETHGAASAADIIDKYIQIVENCLVGDSTLKERKGDEVMIVSHYPDFLLSTAGMFLQNISREENFLQIHGGLHYGKVLKRNESYFGSAINLTARIAAKASPGTFWCSNEFISGITDRTTVRLESKGKHRFKNVNEEIEIAELANEHSDFFVVDPICRMLILDKTTAIQHPEENHLFFCSQACFDIFIKREAAASLHSHN